MALVSRDGISRSSVRAVVHREVEGTKRGLFPLLILAFLIVGGALFYVWQHVQVIRLNYQIERLDSERVSLIERERELTLELARLKSLKRVEGIARERLGMVTPDQGQLYIVSTPENPQKL